ILHASPTGVYRYFRNLIFKMSMKLSGISAKNRYDYYLTSGSKHKCDQQINHPDYDDYLLHKNDAPFIKEKYICFIDTGFGIHPDEKFFDNIQGDNIAWQEKLSSFFTTIEKKYGIPIVIAVHPKVEYPETAFGGRQKIKYHTLNLVLNAEFVLQDMSNSLAFSIIANKKIGLIVTNEFWMNYKDHLTQISQKTGIPLFNIDVEDPTKFSPSTINESLRISYINNYLFTDETKDKLTSSILIDFLKKL
ncbi:MAG: hypothetical protein II716_06070, partial [Treponema sp.]|nr:hypothetical protein [Treponema sp.]